jgi:hypothetical protein
VGEHVAQVDLLRDPGIGQREVREMDDDAVVPAHHAIPDQGCHHRRGYRLGHRRELEHRVSIDRLIPAILADAEALEIDHPVAIDHANR